MIQFNNQNDWKIIQYQGHDIKEAYSSLGKVWSKTQPIPPTIDGKFLFVYEGGDTYSGACDSNDYIANQDVTGSPYPSSSMTNAVIGDCVSMIHGAFGGCSSLTSVTIPDSVTSLKQSAFYACTSLSGITLPTGLTELGVYVFNECTSLTSIDIPSGVTSIGQWAFKNCINLGAVTFPENLQSIGLHAFSTDTSLITPITLPNVREIGDNAFSDCALVPSVSLASVEDIGQFAFYRCSGLTSVEIGSAITNISFAAFSNCSSLESITLHATTPPTLGTYGFFGSTCAIYVPAASVNVYKSATNWSDYASRIQPIPNS